MLQLIRADKNGLITIAKLADTIWHQHYVPIVGIDQVDYMLNLFYSAEALEKQVEKGQNFFFIEVNGSVSGFISYSKTGEDKYFINKFYLLAQEKSRQLGTLVMKHVKNKFRDEMKSKPFEIHLTVNRQNFKAINFYFKNNFRIEKVEDFDIGNGFYMNDFVMMCKM